MKKVFYSVVLVCLLGAAFFLGRSSVLPEESVNPDIAVNQNDVTDKVDNAEQDAADNTQSAEQQEFPVFLGGATELKPADIMLYQEGLNIAADTEVVFRVKCPYGDAAKLLVTYSIKGETDKDVGCFETPDDKSSGELVTTLPANVKRIQIMNDGSHNILIESATLELKK